MRRAKTIENENGKPHRKEKISLDKNSDIKYTYSFVREWDIDPSGQSHRCSSPWRKKWRRAN